MLLYENFCKITEEEESKEKFFFMIKSYIQSLLRYISFFIPLTLLIFVAPSCFKAKKIYKIAVDPTWFPLDLFNKEPYVLAFSEDLVKIIGSKKHFDVKLVPVSWDDILDQLKNKKVDAAMTSMTPYVFNLEKYDFSKNFFLTGPVLILKKEESFSDHSNLEDHEIVVFSQNDEQILLEHYPGAIVRYADSSLKALLDLVDGNVDGVFMSYLEAHSYVYDIYHGLLKVVTHPYTDQGLKLITIKKENHRLVNQFDEGLAELKKSGEYDLLLKKWKLTN